MTTTRRRNAQPATPMTRHGSGGGVSPTLNAMDNTGDTRATVLIFTQNQRDELRDLNGIAGALQAESGAHQTNYVSILGGMTHSLTAEGHDAGEDGTGRGTPIIAFSHTQDCQPSELVTPTVRVCDGGAIAYDEFNETINDTHHTLRAGTKQSTGVVVASQVRRLTPVECERLQGFPDNWTDGQADSARYKQMGNAVAVPVVEWIMRRLVAADEESA